MSEVSSDTGLAQQGDHFALHPRTGQPIDPRPATRPQSQAAEHNRRLDETLQHLQKLSGELTEGDQAGFAPYPARLDYHLPAGFLLSVVIPVYNEVNTIGRVVSGLRAGPLPLEILIVDDCSVDGTREMLRPLESYPQVQVVYQTENCGKGAALRRGFQLAQGDVVAVQDADLEYDPSDLPRLLRPIVEGEADVVYGSRFRCGAPEGCSFAHQWGNRLLTMASNLTTGLRLTDMETCYKLFRRSVLQDLPLAQNRFGFEPEITAKIARRRYRVCELPISYRPRSWEDGKKIGVRDAFSALYCIVRYACAD